MRSAFRLAAQSMGRVFGETVEYDPIDGDAEELDVIIGQEYQALLSGDVRISAKRFEVTVAQMDWEAVFPDREEPKPDDQLTIHGLLWEVATRKIDAEDASWTLVLKRA